MRIAHVTTVHQSDDIRIYRKEVLSLKKSGFDVCVIGPVLEKGKTLEVPHISLPRFRNRLLRMTLGPFLALIKIFKHKIKVVHFHDPELILIGLLLKLFNRIVIFDMHEDTPNQIKIKKYLPKYMRLILSFMTKSFENFLITYFDIIPTAVGHNRFESISENQKNKILLIRNYPKLSEFKDFISNDSKPTNNQLFAIYAGGLSKVRGFYAMVEASKKSRVPIILLGKIYEKKISAFINNFFNNYHNIHYEGFLSFNDLMSHYRKSICGLLVLQPYYYNYSILSNTKIFEYMAAGLPVIASNFPTWREFIETEQCGICVDPTKPEEIAEAINYYVENPEIAWQHGANGRRAVLEKYNWEKEAEKLIEAYKKLLKK